MAFIKRKKSNKKGNWLMDNLGHMVLVAIGIGVGLYLIWAYIYHGTGDSLDKMQQCGALTGSQGECKENCNPVIELEFENLGCKGVTNKCCVPKEENVGDVKLISGFGGGGDPVLFEYEITSLEFGDITNSGCKKDSTSDTKLLVLRCSPNAAHKIPIKMTVKNTGKETVKVYNTPLIVVNANADTTKKLGTYKGLPVEIPASTNPASTNNEKEVNIDLSISSRDAVKNDFWTIYPYAKCDTTDCQKRDTRGRGVLRLNSQLSLKIKYVSD